VSKKTSKRNPQASLEEVALEGWDILKKYRGQIIGAITAVTLFVAVFVYQDTESSSLNAKAWLALYEAEEHYKEKIQNKPIEERKEKPKFEQITKDFKGHPVEPFALLKQANVHYRDGGREDLEKAKKLLEEFLKSYKKFDLYEEVAQKKIDAIKKELDHKASWIAIKKEADKDEVKNPEATNFDSIKDPKKATEPKSVDHDHDGDGKPDHGPGEHKDEPKKDGQ
jgi:hypothetical protein